MKHRLFYLFFTGTVLSISTIAIADIRSGTIQSNERWNLADSPYVIEKGLVIPESVTITVDPGVIVSLGSDAVVTIEGRFEALGSASAPIRFEPASDSRWGAISYDDTGSGRLQHCVFSHGTHASGERIGMVNVYRCAAPIIIENCTFTDWPDDFNAKAFHAHDSSSVEIRYCYFGPGTNEAVHGVNSPVLVEYCTFDHRYGYSDTIDVSENVLPDPVPIIRYNVFRGSEDDAIDLDRCDAYVEGNLVIGCRGGSHDPIGISGDKDSRPTLVNNVVADCEIGIGFKNGADITIINNTIIDCDRGIWMHQNPAHARAINTIIWGRGDQTSIKLEPGSTIDISYSIIKGDPLYPGIGNLNSDPLFLDPTNGDYHLKLDSPAIDAGLGMEGVPDHDYDRLPRNDNAARANTGSGTPAYTDISAFEFQPPATSIDGWRFFDVVRQSQ